MSLQKTAAHDVSMSTGVVVERMKKEILALIKSETIPLDVATFAELHDYIDANALGGFCEDDLFNELVDRFGGRDSEELGGGMPQGMLDYINHSQDAINTWIVSGAMKSKAKL